MPLTGLTPPHFVCLSQVRTSISNVIWRCLTFFCIQWAKMWGIVCFVDIGGIVNHHCLEVIVCFVDICGIVNHHCLKGIVCFVDIGGIVNHHCLKAIVYFVDIGGIVDHHLFKVIVRFVDIGGIVDHHLFKVMFALLILVELLTIACLRWCSLC